MSHARRTVAQRSSSKGASRSVARAVKPPRETPDSARAWLRANGYDDIANIIDGIMVRWLREGKATRRNWWEILAGDRQGRPRIVAGIEFPVLAAAQSRCGRAATANAMAKGA